MILFDPPLHSGALPEFFTLLCSFSKRVVGNYYYGSQRRAISNTTTGIIYPLHFPLLAKNSRKSLRSFWFNGFALHWILFVSWLIPPLRKAHEDGYNSQSEPCHFWNKGDFSDDTAKSYNSTKCVDVSSGRNPEFQYTKTFSLGMLRSPDRKRLLPPRNKHSPANSSSLKALPSKLESTPLLGHKYDTEQRVLSVARSRVASATGCSTFPDTARGDEGSSRGDGAVFPLLAESSSLGVSLLFGRFSATADEGQGSSA